MSFFLNILAVGALIAMCYALWRPEKMYPFKNPVWIKAVGLYFGLAVVFFILAASLSSDTPETPDRRGASDVPAEERALPVKAGPLTWKEIGRETLSFPDTGRDWLVLAIVPVEDQSRAEKKELLSTATSVAIRAQKENGAPVVVVNLVCQEADNALARRPLAHVVYIFDGKGFDGLSDSGQWETLRAARRGFTQAELEYLKAHAELYNEFHSAMGLREKELDEAVSERLGIRPGSMRPFENRLEDAPR